MPHAKEHPLSGYHVVPDERTGEEIYVVDWLDRLEGTGYLLRPSNPIGTAFRERIEALGLHESGAVLARSGAGFQIIHHDELVSYDPVPVGVIS